MSHIQAFLVLAGLMVLSASMVIAWCIATDEKYMNNVWREDNELRGKR